MNGKFCHVCFVIALAITIAATVSSGQTQQLAYVQVGCCLTGGACDAFCPYPNEALIVSPFVNTSGPYDTQPTSSPDGKEIAFTRGNDIFVATAAGTAPVNITNTGNNVDPAWSPDGSRIAFATARDGHPELYLVNPDGSSVVRLTYNVASSVGHPAWSHDGTRIAFTCQVEAGNDDICAINPDGTAFARLTTDSASEFYSTWSPDSQNIAFSSSQYGFAVMNADGSDVRPLGAGVSGSDLAWSPDGAQIAFDAFDSDGFPSIYLMQADGTNLGFFGYSEMQPAWIPAQVPIATFKVTCSGTTCNFDASNSKDAYGTITSYAWNFGDGITAAGSSVAHTYTGGGRYSVKLTVIDNNGATGTKFQTVTINPVAAFTFSCSELACNFDGSGSKDLNATITNYAWKFGDGMTGAGVTVTHTYAAGGAYNATLTVTDSTGATSTQSETVNVNVPPIASFTFVCNALTCNFDGSGSSDSNGTITSYAWKFGDGMTGAGVAITHTYATGGAYSATLTVADSTGATSTQSKTVNVNTPPIASFTFVCNALTCNFDGSGSRDPDGTITSYTWSFGDGATGSGATVSHMYAAGGKYPVTLTVTDNGSATATQSNAVTANSPPVASFKFSCQGHRCSFDGSASTDSDGTVTNYVWNFGDGATGSGAMVTHNYAGPGTYTVKLTVTDNGGATGVKSNNVEVAPNR
jgi:PKD repeat protein